MFSFNILMECHSIKFLQVVHEIDIDCILVQEPYAISGETIQLAYVPNGFIGMHSLS